MNKKRVITVICVLVMAVMMINAVPAFKATSASADNIKIKIDGEYINCTSAPYIDNGTTMVPFRSIFESFGMSVVWWEKSKQIRADYHTESFYVIYNIDSVNQTMTIEACEYDMSTKGHRIGEDKYLPIALVSVFFGTDLKVNIVNGVTYVAARAISEALGAKVEWDSKSRTVIISTENAVIVDPRYPDKKVTVDRSLIIEAKSARFKAAEDELVKLVNEARISKGAPALTQDDDLTKLARIKAQEMADKGAESLEFSSGMKQYLKDNSIETLFRSSGYVVGQKTLVEIIEQWKTRVNFDYIQVTHTGIGGAMASDGTMYWVYLNAKPFRDREKAALEDEVIRLINEERKKQGLSSVVKNKDLAKVARMKAQDMADNDYCTHKSPVYGYPGDMVRQYTDNITFFGENVAGGQETAYEVFMAWMNSPGHKAVMLDKSLNCAGVGVSLNDKGSFLWSLITAIE